MILSSAAVGGKKEQQGPLGEFFDICDPSDKFGMDTFEKAENEMQRVALALALKKSEVAPECLDAIFAGDLMNQCTGSSYGLASFGAPYFGLYGACSTAAEGLILSAVAIESGAFETVAAVTSSHNSSAERQFRFPLEYGSQRTPTAQWTATASGAFVLSGKQTGDIAITEALVGRIVDKGICDANNMGAAMAPAAATTLYEYFCQSGEAPGKFGAILTGDLGIEGHSICRELLSSKGVRMGDNFCDCGALIYDCQRQDTHSGGSGCGCSASVTAGYVLEKMKRGELDDVLLVGTGALMSPSALLQGLSIAGIGHLVRIKRIGDREE